jgi:hypothetical protein
MSGSSEGDAEGGEGSGGVAGVVTEGSGEADRPARLSRPMARLRRQAMRLGPVPVGGVLGEGDVADGGPRKVTVRRDDATGNRPSTTVIHGTDRPPPTQWVHHGRGPDHAGVPDRNRPKILQACTQIAPEALCRPVGDRTQVRAHVRSPDDR